MSDQPPPPKPKPGSLRDRIAAFEKQNASAPGPTPPAPRPKPGNVQWKPKQASPPASPGRSSVDTARSPSPGADRVKAGGMSAADAKESIGKGVSLKERMAALQGRGAFGPSGAPSPPPPKPASDKPKWKPPVPVALPDEEETTKVIDESVKSHTDEGQSESAQISGEEGKVALEPGEEAEQEVDPEEEERQRRAALAARMARLGGARIGMAPPVLGKKPTVKKVDAPKEEEVAKTEEAVKLDEVKPVDTESLPDSISLKSPPVEGISEGLDSKKSEEEGYFKDPDSTSSAHLSPNSASIPSARSPSSMPVPAGPRRAAPPRKKAAKSPSPAPPPILDDQIKENPPEIPASETVSAEGEVGVEEVGDVKAVVEQLGEVKTPALALDDASGIAPETPVLSEDISSLGASHADVESDDLAEQSQKLAEIEVDVEEPVSITPPAHLMSESEDMELPTAQSSDPVPPEEDEETRRKRVAERLAKMGGINPFSAPSVSPPSPSERPEPVRKQSIGFAASQPLPMSPAPIERRSSTRKDSADSGISSNLERRASARKSSTDSSILPSAAGMERRSSVRKDSTDSSGVLEKRASVSSRRSTVDNVPSPSAPAPTSPRLESTTREDSVASMGSVSSSRRGESEDDRNVSLSSEHTVEEQVEEELEEQQPDDEFGRTASDDETTESHEMFHSAAGSVDLEHETGVYETPDEVQASGEQDAMSRSSDEHGELQDDEEEPIPVPPPSVIRRPSAPNRDTQSPVAPQESAVERELAESTPKRQESSRRSLPPPPRALPVPPPPPIETYEEDVENERDSEQEIEIAPYLDREVSSQPLTDDEEGELPLTPVPRAVQAEHNAIITMSPSATPPELQETQSVRPLPRPPVPASTRPTPSNQSGGKGQAPLIINTDSEEEIMDESDGDPIDPQFHSPQKSPSIPPIVLPETESPIRTAELPSPSTPSTPKPSTSTVSDTTASVEEDPEQARRRTIAERMSKLGGIKFGAPPPVRPPPPPAPAPAVSEGEVAEESTADLVPAAQEPLGEPKEEEEEDEQARRQRIAARLANMGGMRFGMLPGAVPQQAPRPSREESKSPPPPPRRAVPPARPPPPSQTQELEEELETDDDGVQVEAEESDLEEVTYEDAVEEAPPPVPSREHRHKSAIPVPPPPALQRVPSQDMGPISPTVKKRPPVPVTPVNVSSRRSAASSTDSYMDPGVTSYPPPPVVHARPPVSSEYVMVEDSQVDTELEAPPPPPHRTSHRPPPARSAPSVPPPLQHSDSTASQWELPSIPSGTLDFGGTSDLSESMWSEDSTHYPSEAPSAPPKFIPSRPTSQLPSSSASAHDPSKPTGEVQISPEELMNIWGKVGIQVCEVATTFFEKSKKALIGDGTYAGFVDAVLNEVPNASFSSPPSYGYLVYAQTGSTVQRRVSEIMPGDIITAQDAKLKGHKGLQTYHQNVGSDDLLVGVVTEFEAKKSKCKVLQANQHVGQQTVESASYRLEDLKSGTIKIYRVLEAS